MQSTSAALAALGVSRVCILRPACYSLRLVFQELFAFPPLPDSQLAGAFGARSFVLKLSAFLALLLGLCSTAPTFSTGTAPTYPVVLNRPMPVSFHCRR